MIDGFLTAFGWTFGIIVGVYAGVMVVEKTPDAIHFIRETWRFMTWK